MVGKDPDCSRKDKTICNPSVIRRNIDGNKDITIHEGYDEKANFKHDIALIRMNDPIPLYQEDPKLSAANPICLPWSKESIAYSIQDGNRTIVAGWGRTRPKQDKKATEILKEIKASVAHLQAVNVPINNRICKRLGLTDTRICAGGEESK